MTGDISRSATHRIGVAGAILLISASASLGAYFGYTVGSHVHWLIGVVFAAAALGGELLKPFAVSAAFQSARFGNYGRTVSCAVLAIACVTYSVASELSLSAGGRGDLAAQRQQGVDRTAAVRERRTRAIGELQTLPPARHSAEVEPEITKLLTTKGANGCSGDETTGARGACAKVSTLRSEIARFKRREELEARIASADRDLNSAPDAVADSDPLASAVTAYGRQVGFEWTADTVAPWLALIPVLFLEIGSALSLVALGTPSANELPACPPPNRPRHPRNRARKASTYSDAALPPSTTAPVSDQISVVCKSAIETDNLLSARVTALLASRGGRIVSGQRALGRTLGISKSRLNELLHELAAAGRIALETSPSGTAVALR